MPRSIMRDPRCWREVLLRAGMTGALAAIAFFILHAEPWVWLLPVVIAAMVLLKWAFRPEDEDENGDDKVEPPIHDLS